MKTRVNAWMIFDKHGRARLVSHGKKLVPSVAVFPTRAGARACISNNPDLGEKIVRVVITAADGTV